MCSPCGHRDFKRAGSAKTSVKPGPLNKARLSQPFADNCTQSLEEQLQEIVDRGLSEINNIEACENDPDRRLSRSMEASLKVWNKLTEIRNNYKNELKKKQDERFSFENDIKKETEKIADKIGEIDEQIVEIDDDTATIEKELQSAECYRKKIDDDTKLMEEHIQALVTEDEALQSQIKQTDHQIRAAQQAFWEAEMKQEGQKERMAQESDCAEIVFQQEVQKRKDELMVAEYDQEILEKQLADYDHCSPLQRDIESAKSELRKMRDENDIIGAENDDIQQHNKEMCQAKGNVIGEKYKAIREKEALRANEEKRMKKERKNQNEKEKQQKIAIADLKAQQRAGMQRQAELECDSRQLEIEIEEIMCRCRQKEKALADACELLEWDRNANEVDVQFKSNLRQLEDDTNEKLRDLQSEIRALSEQKINNMGNIRNICEAISEMKERVQEPERMCAPTFRRLRDLTAEYEKIKDRNERSNNTITFYDKIRASENQYAQLRSALSSTKAHHDFSKQRHQTSSTVRARSVEKLKYFDRRRQSEFAKPFSALNTNACRKRTVRNERLDVPVFGSIRESYSKYCPFPNAGSP